MTENSPPFQRWELVFAEANKPQRGERICSQGQGGSIRPLSRPSLPSLAGLAPLLGSYPPINRWAIFFRPAGLALISNMQSIVL